MGLHLEHHGQPIADVHGSSVFLARWKQNPRGLGWEVAQQRPRVLVGAVLAPEGAEHAQLDRVGLSAQPLHDEAVLLLGKGDPL